MFLFLSAIALPVLAAVLGLFFRPRVASWLGMSGAVTGSVLGLMPAAWVLATGRTISQRWPWHVPYGEFSLAIDQLTALFLLAIFGLVALAAIYGRAYLEHQEGKRPVAWSWLLFNLLLASMALLVAARNGILFLMAWETMAVSSFFLVTFDHERQEVRSAGWTYLVAAHAGTAFLLAFFAILGRESGSLDFERMGQVALRPAMASGLFLLALVGFGAKAGFVPFHVWLPEAHPAAPSHVSAVMSGVMIKTGIYGIMRALTFLGPPEAWWGIMLIGIGLLSGVLGVLFALAQHDLKRLLAYHSIENIGIIALGIGVGVWGLSQDLPMVAILGFAGACLHVVNHAVFKALLFLSAGSVLHATGERELDKLGGLLKKMPVTGAMFLVGAAAISGLPPLSGFVSEFLIFMGSLRGVSDASVGMVVPLAAAIAGLGLIGGLAVACFTKAFGIIFLGSPRTEEAGDAHESNAGFLFPMLALAGIIVFVGALPFLSARVALPAAAELAGVDRAEALAAAAGFSGPLGKLTLVALVALGIVAFLALVRWRLLRPGKVRAAPTWDCGYETPGPRMQYTGSSFAQPIVELFRLVLLPQQRTRPPTGYFPKAASYHSETPDLFTERVYRPLLGWVEWAGTRLHLIQHGRVHLYLLYIFVTLVVLMVWRLGF